MRYAKDGRPQCTQCFKKFSGWPVFMAHFNQKSCNTKGQEAEGPSSIRQDRTLNKYERHVSLKYLDGSEVPYVRYASQRSFGHARQKKDTSSPSSCCHVPDASKYGTARYRSVVYECRN